MSTVKGSGIGLRIARVRPRMPNITTRRPTPICGAARPAPLRSRMVSRISRSSCLQFGSAECLHRLGDCEQARIAHFEYFAYCHGS